MLNTSEAYKAAIIANSRQIVPRAVIDLISPDVIYEGVTSSGESYFSRPGDLYEKTIEATGPTYATLEKNRWILNGKQNIYPDDPTEIAGHQGFLGAQLSGPNGEIDAFVELELDNVSILQAASVHFTGREIDGYATDFTFEVYSGESLVYSNTITGNRQKSVHFDGFTVHSVTALRVSITRWSMPSRRVRMVEIMPGIYEEWDGSTIFSLDVMEQADFSCASLPISTATLEIHNKSRRFDPRNKSGLFKSIEARQGIPLWLGTETEDGIEYVPVGQFFQQSAGWTIANYGLTMRWKLVSIIGLLANRKFKPPEVLPTTLGGWLAEIVSQLGINFVGRYRIEGDKGSVVLTCADKDVENITCGNLLRFLCQASGTYPKADPETGYLWAAILPAETAGKTTLDNLSSEPDFNANNDVASLVFKIDDTQFVVPGTNPASDKTLSVSNPFLKDSSSAALSAKNILVNYGGNKIAAKGRGDMSREIGDVEIVELAAGYAVSGRRTKQQFRLADGIMKDVQSEFLQAEGSELYTSHEAIIKSGSWTAPPGVTRLKVILGSGGDGGEPGTDGTWSEDGKPGSGGLGGLIAIFAIDINEGQSFEIIIGDGGAPGQPGTASTFGAYSSASGERYDGFADIGSNMAFGLPGRGGSAISPPANSGSGGGGGTPGLRGISGTDNKGNWYVRRHPASGGLGASGASGFAIVYWGDVDA